MTIRKITILLLFFLLFFLQNRYAISAIDDWVYTFIVNENTNSHLSIMDDGVIRYPIASFHDALLSQSRDYFISNGRFIVHTLVQYFCGTMTMQTFVIFNTLIFGLFTMLVIQLTNRKINTFDLLFVLSAIWILIPHKGLTFMGNISLSINYLWTSVATLSFILMIEKLCSQKHISWGHTLFACMMALIAGSLQESFSIGVSGAIIFYCLFNHQNISKQLMLILTAYLLGTMICVLSPANFGRTEDIGGIGFHWRCLMGIVSSPPIILSAISTIIIAKRGQLIPFVKRNYFLLFASVINLMFASFIAYNGRHQLTAVNICCMVVLLRIWFDLDYPRLRKTISVMLTSIAILSYYPILQNRQAYHQAFTILTKRAHSDNHHGIISGAEFEKLTEQIKHNPILECNYIAVFTFQNWDFYEHSFSSYLTKGKNNRLIEEIKK